MAQQERFTTSADLQTTPRGTPHETLHGGMPAKGKSPHPGRTSKTGGSKSGTEPAPPESEHPAMYPKVSNDLDV